MHLCLNIKQYFTLISVNIYSSLCYSTPVWLYFFCVTQKNILCFFFQDTRVSHETFIPHGNIQCRHQHALQKPCNCLGSKSSQVTSTVLLGKIDCKEKKKVEFIHCPSNVAGLNRLSQRVSAVPLLSWRCAFSRLLWSSSLITSMFCSVPNSAPWSATAQVRNETRQFSSHQNWFLD